MLTSFLEGRSYSDQKQALLRISQYILREQSENIRDSLYKSLLEIGILLNERPATTLQEVIDNIEKNFFGIRIKTDVANIMLESLVKEKRIDITEGKIKLIEKRKNEIEAYSENSKKLILDIEKRYIEKIIQAYKQEINSSEINNIIDSYYYFILILISKYVVNTAIMLVKGRLIEISFGTGQTIIDESLHNIEKPQLKEIISQTLMEWMQNPEDDFIEYLYHMRQNFLCIEVLNLDPECRTLSKEEFSKIHLYLDNNVLMSYAIDIYHSHERTINFIENTKSLGCNIYVTKRTVNEFLDVLERSYVKHKEVVKAEGDESKTGNAFIINFLAKNENGYEGTLEEYYDGFKNILKILDDNGIKYIDEINNDIISLDKYDNLIYQIQRCFMIHRGREKKVIIAEHDAYHILLIKALREYEHPTFLGSNNWFLTYDLTLPCVDKLVNRLFPFTNSTSSVMVAYLWDEIISPFLVGTVDESELIEVFKKFISSDFIPISQGSSFNILTKLKIDWTEYEWLSIDEIQELLNQEFVIDFIKKQDEISKTDNKELLEEVRSDFNTAFTSHIAKIAERKIYDAEMAAKKAISEVEKSADTKISEVEKSSKRKIKEIEKRLKTKEQETTDLQITVKQLLETKETLNKNLNKEETLTYRMRYASGISGLILFLVGIYGLVIVIPNQTLLHVSIAYIACLIVGVFLLLLAIRPEQVSGIINLGANINK